MPVVRAGASLFVISLVLTSVGGVDRVTKLRR